MADVLKFLASQWRWFLLSVVVFGGLAWYKAATTPYTYFRAATVIIKDPSNKTSTAGLDRYDNLVNKVNVANEILQFNSKALMREVVTRVRADVSYQIAEGLRDIELYTQSPVLVTFPEATPKAYYSMAVSVLDKQTVRISNFNGKAGSVDVKLNKPVIVHGVKLTVAPTNFYSDSWKGKSIQVRKLPLEAVVARYLANLGIKQEEDEASILKLSLKDNSPARAEDVLNMLITVYNEDAINDKNQVAINTADFIHERLQIIEKELGSVESDLENFKRSNDVVNIESKTGQYMSESQQSNALVMEMETQLRLANFIKDYLTDPTKERDLIPSNTGISDAGIEGQIAQYNTMKLRRDKLIDDSSEQNPVVLELNNSLRAMKQNIIRAVDNLIVSIEVRRNDAERREMRARAGVSTIPTKERQMLTIERQQKIKESLYMFLLNRREENALSQAMADNNARVIDAADGSDFPISPDRNRIILLGILLGLAVPGAVFLLISFMDNKVRSRKDVQNSVTVPFLGEIPLDADAKKLRKEKKHLTAPINSVEGDGMVAEAFRILRSNLAFMIKKNHSVQVITLTSFDEGAGKTFIAHNLGLSLAATGKKVVMVDLDIRKGTYSRYLKDRKKGVTTYLLDPKIKVDDIIQRDDNYGNVDIIAAGPIAPNPAELLLNERLDELMNELRQKYDYVIADNVPVGLVADASIVSRVTDVTLFVIRAGRLDRRQLVDIEDLYEDDKLSNMALVLNGVTKRSHGYG